MWKIEELERPLGPPDQAPQSIRKFGEFRSREAAAEEIDQLVRQRRISGYDATKDFWWCRNKGDQRITIYSISP
jgi:hypothetical protein